MERIEMSGKEVKRREVLCQVSDGMVRQSAAAQALGLSVRQVRRLQRRYEESGATGLVSHRRGKPSNRRIPNEIKDAILARLRECYADFGPTLAAEYLQEDGLQVSKETLRGWMIEAGLWQAAKVRFPRNLVCQRKLNIESLLEGRQ